MSAKDIRGFFASYPPPVPETAMALRDLIFDCLGEPEEALDRAARVVGYGFGPGYKGTICTVIMSKGGVKLGLPYAMGLPDPRGLLAGAGKVHRHVAFRSPADVKRVGVKHLLDTAYAAWKKRTAPRGRPPA